MLIIKIIICVLLSMMLILSGFLIGAQWALNYIRKNI